MMQCDWLGERVATVDVDRAIANVINNKEDAGWGPNAVFRLARNGGRAGGKRVGGWGGGAGRRAGGPTGVFTPAQRWRPFTQHHLVLRKACAQDAWIHQGEAKRHLLAPGCDPLQVPP